MANPTGDELNKLVEAVRFNLSDLGDATFFKKDYLETALRLSLWDASLATARILESIATQKAMMGKRAQFGSVTIDNSIKDLKELAAYYRSKVGEEKGTLPPLVSVHTDGTVSDGRPEFNKIGIEGVEEGERTDDNIKPRYGERKEI